MCQLRTLMVAVVVTASFTVVGPWKTSISTADFIFQIIVNLLLGCKVEFTGYQVLFVNDCNLSTSILIPDGDLYLLFLRLTLGHTLSFKRACLTHQIDLKPFPTETGQLQMGSHSTHDSSVEYAYPVWKKINTCQKSWSMLNSAYCLITGLIKPTNANYLHLFTGSAPSDIIKWPFMLRWQRLLLMVINSWPDNWKLKTISQVKKHHFKNVF